MMLLAKELYDNALKEINGFTFTPREIDVIACILHNRGEKKIAFILGISPNTVNTHVYNIMNKLGYNSRESIIDFIEISKKLIYIKKYYFYLLESRLFKKYMQKIGSIINVKGVVWTILYNDELSNRSLQIIQNLTAYLKLANIKLIRKNSNSAQIQHLPLGITDVGLITVENSSLIKTYVIFDYVNEIQLDSLYVDFKNIENFYISLFTLIQQILNKSDLSIIFKDYKKEYNSLQTSWEVTGAIKDEQKITNSKKPIKIVPKKVSVSIVVALILLISSVAYYIKTISNSHVLKSIVTEEKRSKSYEILDEMFSLMNSSLLSADNLTSGNLYKNNIFIKHFEQVDKNYNQASLMEYFTNPKNSKNFVRYLYIHYAAATYYCNQTDNIKAQNSLTKAIAITEAYLNNLNKIQVNFNILTPEELMNELDGLEALPQIYTKILYVLGRSYMLQGKFEDAIHNFTKAKFMGNKLDLFEGYLGEFKGLMEIEFKQALIDIKNDNHKTAKNRLLKLLELYTKYKINDKKYITNYVPYKESKQSLLQNNMQHMIECGAQSFKIYGSLQSITTTQKKRQLYDNLMLEQIIGNNSYQGIIYFLDKVTLRKKANILNIIGNTLLQMYDNKLDIKPLKIKLTRYLNLAKAEDIDFIEQIFELANSSSKINDCTKINSLDNLSKIYERK